MKAAIASTYYADLGIDEDDIFVSDGAKSDISRLQVLSFIIIIIIILLYNFFFVGGWGWVLVSVSPKSRSLCVYALPSLCTHYPSNGCCLPIALAAESCLLFLFWQVLFGSNVTMAVQDPSYPVNILCFIL